MLGSDTSLDAPKRALIERTDGNPFFSRRAFGPRETKALVGETGRLPTGARCHDDPGAGDGPGDRRDANRPPGARGQAAAPGGGGHRQRRVHARCSWPLPTFQSTRCVSSLTHLQAAEFLYQVRIFPDLEYTLQARAHPRSGVRWTAPRPAARPARPHHRGHRAAVRRPAGGARREARVPRRPRRAVGRRRLGTPTKRGSRQSTARPTWEAIDTPARGSRRSSIFRPRPMRSRYELKPRSRADLALIATRGYAAPEVRAGVRAPRALCEEVGESAQLLLVLRSGPTT